ncbi:MAG: dockerin type I repeat-containing protein, partial [Oscillospiraceae bacterium]|nr:dockerin type I repeat-containing protein [Oscillospiraceae bacterium]
TTTTEPTTTTTTTTTTTGPQEPIQGDVDNNGTVNAKDLMKLKQYLLLAASKDTVPNGDVNKDGNINAFDLVHLVKILLEM